MLGAVDGVFQRALLLPGALLALMSAPAPPALRFLAATPTRRPQTNRSAPLTRIGGCMRAR
jgi:hypothetical protein